VATSSIDRASLVGDLVLGHPLERGEVITTKAAVIGATRDEDLRGEVDIGPGGVSCDLDAVRDYGSGGVGPARSAVLGNVLVPNVGQVVHSIDVVPDPLFWKCLGSKYFKWLGNLVCGSDSLPEARVNRINVFEGRGVTKYACGGKGLHRSN